MRKISMKEIIGKSFERSNNILFKPFSLKKWLILFFIAIFAGALSLGNGSGGGNSRGKNSPDRITKSADLKQDAQKSATETSSVQRPQVRVDHSSRGLSRRLNRLLRPDIFLIVIGVVSAIGLVLIGLYLLFLWIYCRFRFVWFNAIAANDASVVEPFHRHRPEGKSFFNASVLIALISFGVFFSILGWAIYALVKAGAFAANFPWSLQLALQILSGPGLALIIAIILTVILHIAISHFTVMIMALDEVKFLPAFKKTLEIYKENLGSVILYHLILLLFVIVALIILFIAFFICLILFLISALIFGFAGYLLFVALLKAKIAFLIYCLIIGIPLFAILFLCVGLIQLPIAVFFASFAIEFLLALDCGYSLDSLNSYVLKERSQNRSKAAIVVPIVVMLFIWIIFIAALLAAIAIPNIIRARQAALNKKNIAVSSDNVIPKQDLAPKQPENINPPAN